jgi:hypothetical protein
MAQFEPKDYAKNLDKLDRAVQLSRSEMRPAFWVGSFSLAKNYQHLRKAGENS